MTYLKNLDFINKYNQNDVYMFENQIDYIDVKIALKDSTPINENNIELLFYIYLSFLIIFKSAPLFSVSVDKKKETLDTYFSQQIRLMNKKRIQELLKIIKQKQNFFMYNEMNEKSKCFCIEFKLISFFEDADMQNLFELDFLKDYYVFININFKSKLDKKYLNILL